MTITGSARDVLHVAGISKYSTAAPVESRISTRPVHAASRLPSQHLTIHGPQLAYAILEPYVLSLILSASTCVPSRRSSHNSRFSLTSRLRKLTMCALSVTANVNRPRQWQRRLGNHCRDAASTKLDSFELARVVHVPCTSLTVICATRHADALSFAQGPFRIASARLLPRAASSRSPSPCLVL